MNNKNYILNKISNKIGQIAILIDPEKNCGPSGSVNLVQNKFKYKDHPKGMVGVGGEEELIFSVSD